MDPGDDLEVRKAIWVLPASWKNPIVLNNGDLAGAIGVAPRSPRMRPWLAPPISNSSGSSSESPQRWCNASIGSVIARSVVTGIGLNPAPERNNALGLVSKPLPSI